MLKELQVADVIVRECTALSEIYVQKKNKNNNLWTYIIAIQSTNAVNVGI